jgi:tRNA(Arg) A34 adenosine deaminase TadA
MSKRLYHQCLQIAKKNIHRCTETNNHFSFIIQDNKIIAWGFNRRGRVHKKLGYNWYSNIHSEVDAFKRAKRLLDASNHWYIINIRLNNLLQSMTSSPCSCCYNFLQFLGCTKVLFSVEEGFNKLKI